MYCSSCGVELKDDSSFCYKCGKPTDTPQSINNESQSPDVNVKSVTSQVPVTPVAHIPKVSLPQKIAIILLAFFAVSGFFFAHLEPALRGVSYDSANKYAANDAKGALLFFVLLFWYLYKLIKGWKWRGILIGIVAYILFGWAAESIAIYVRNQPEYRFANNPLATSFKDTYPDDYLKIKESLKSLAAKDGLDKKQVLDQLIANTAKSLLPSALLKTSDTALTNFVRTKMQIAAELSKGNPYHCVLVYSGPRSEKDAAVMRDINKIISSSSSVALAESMMHVLKDASRSTVGLTSQDKERAQQILQNIDASIASKYKIGLGDVFNGSYSEQSYATACEVWTSFFTVATGLPPKDRQPLLRYMFTE